MSSSLVWRYGVAILSCHQLRSSHGWPVLRSIYEVRCLSPLSELYSLMSSLPRTQDLTMVRVLSRCKIDSLNSRVCKIVPSRDPITEGCAALKTHRGLANAIAVLAVDVTLLIGMLIGLLRSAHKSSTGIWYLLYQQVTPSSSFTLAADAEDLPSASSGYSWRVSRRYHQWFVVAYIVQLLAFLSSCPGFLSSQLQRYVLFTNGMNRLLLAIRIDPWNEVWPLLLSPAV
jgi:hypothetical protein